MNFLSQRTYANFIFGDAMHILLLDVMYGRIMPCCSHLDFRYRESNKLEMNCKQVCVLYAYRGFSVLMLPETV